MNKRFSSIAVALWAAFAFGSYFHAQAQNPGSPTAGANLIPNGNFTASDPLESWRVDFPYEGWYTKNKNYVSVTTEHAKPGEKCVVITLPPGVAGNEGGKIESAFIKAEPGATYRIEVDTMPWDFSVKLFAEAWVTDPQPISNPDKLRVPAREGHPALAMVYRAPVPDPKGDLRKWQTVSREFKLPLSTIVAGEEMAPEFLSLKAYTYGPTPNGGKAYFGNFRLFKIKSAPSPAP